MKDIHELKTWHIGETVLHPSTPQRMIAAQSIGLKYPAIGEEGAATFDKTNSYPGMLVDMIIVIGVCLTPSDASEGKSETGVQNVGEFMSKPEKSFQALMKWAEQFGLVTPFSKLGKLCTETFMGILDEVSANYFNPEVDSKEGKEDPNEV